MIDTDSLTRRDTCGQVTNNIDHVVKLEQAAFELEP